MKQLSKMHLVQYSFWDYETFNFQRNGTAFIGPNGAGKTSLVDALQIALIGAHGNFLQFNAQSVQKDSREIRDYALGTMRSGEGASGTLNRKRDEALSYITLVFEGERPEEVISAGLCIHAKASERGHRVLGMFVLPGVGLELKHHLEALPDGYFSPLDWNVFEAGIRNMARKAGREPTITSHPEAYIKELLHAIQGKGPSINHETFLRALAQSLRLKGVNSINDFIRENLVSAKPIDRQGTLRHIKTLQDLSTSIAIVRDQILRLDDIESDYKKLASFYRTRASAQVANINIQIESADERIYQLLEQQEKDRKALDELKEEMDTLEGEELRQQKLERDLANQIAADPEAQAPEQARQLKEAHLGTLSVQRRGMERRMLDIRDALDSIATSIKQSDHEFPVNLEPMIQTWAETAKKGEIPSLQHFADTLHLLHEIKETIQHLSNKATTAAADATSQLSNLMGHIAAANKGMRTQNLGNLGAAIELLQEQGIGSRTVASLVKVSDVQWQPAIESFLGRNRFALVVDEGKERDAVQLIRQTTRHLFDITIVQPYHLKQSIGIDPDPYNVGALLTGDHPVALAYLRQIIGRMRQVSTEEELERHERSLTRDGMLSANGGTRRIKLIEENDLVLGATVSELEKSRLHEELMQAIKLEEHAKALANIAKKADERLRGIIQSADLNSIRDELESLAVARTAYESLPSPDQTEVPDRLKNLMELRTAAQEAFRKANSLRMGKSGEWSKSQLKLDTLNADIGAEEQRVADMKLMLESLTQDIDYDGETSIRIYDEVSDIANTDGLEKALAHIKEKYLTLESRIYKLEADSGVKLKLFTGEYSLDVMDELQDWRKSHEWVIRYKQRLIDSDLANYQKQADEAREAANDAFHHDVALKLREASHRVGQEIDDLNRILKGCPEFTGGERYHFIADKSSEFSWLHDMIENVSHEENSTLQLFSSDSDDGNRLADFLEACESGNNKGNNPLEDHRLLFKFDLEILVDGKKVDVLSRRLGVGSNGEHLIPFYVIAGATLVNAYRMKPGSSHDGVTLMILDEAFHGFDAQNAYVTAQFLNSLGLQLVMAAPDSDIGKLTPCLGNFYDLWRHGAEVEADETIVKEDARKLMISDIPDINPDLVKQAVLELSP